MNVLFFLTPKNKVEYIYDYYSMRQALEKMQYHKYSAIPVLNKTNEYVGTISEGDLLWYIKETENFNLKDAENIMISNIKRSRDIKPIKVICEMDNLISLVINQNFVPVIDDYNKFIGIVTRKDVITYCYNELEKK